MGQNPSSRLFYGIYYKEAELSGDIIAKMRDDVEEVIYELLGISKDLPWDERAKLRGAFGSFYLGNRTDLILCGFYVYQSGWGFKKFHMPSVEEIAQTREKLLALAKKVGLPGHNIQEPGWYLEADFG
jgi:hypothetical protein